MIASLQDLVLKIPQQCFSVCSKMREDFNTIVQTYKSKANQSFQQQTLDNEKIRVSDEKIKGLESDAKTLLEKYDQALKQKKFIEKKLDQKETQLKQAQESVKSQKEDSKRAEKLEE